MPVAQHEALVVEQTIEPKRRGRHLLAPLNPLRENGHGKAWAEDAKSNIRYLRSRLDAVSSRAYASTHHPACDHAASPDRQIDRMQVAVDARAQLDIAYAAATGMRPRYIPVVSAWNGACIEAAYKNIHYAEALIAHLYNEEDVRHAAPDALRRVKAALAPGDPTLQAATKLWQEADRPTCSCMAGRLGEVIAVGHEAADRSRARLHMFRNVLIAGTILTTILLAFLVYLAWNNPTVVSLCFTKDPAPDPPGFAVVCPTGGSAKGAATATAAPGDVLTVALVGLFGGCLSALVFIRRLYGNATPYNVAIPLAVLKIPAGAAVSVGGMILVAGDFVPGFSAIDKPGQIIAYALIFGFAQQLFTQMLDRRAMQLISSIPSKERRDDLPPTAS
jgi:hypothetical protein